MAKINTVDMYKSVVGWTEHKTDDEKHKATHKLLSNNDWGQLMDYINRLKDKTVRGDQELNKKDNEMARIHDDYKSEIIEAERKNTEDKRKLLEEIERQKSLNENLLRISRERKNAERGLQPKKKHPGYKYIGKIAQIKVVKELTKKDGNKYGSAWSVMMETPYDATIPLVQIQDRINNDLFAENGLCSRMLIHVFTIENDIGKNRIWTGEYKEAVAGIQKGDKRSFLYDVKFSANPKSRLWEVQLFTTGWIKALPELF